MCRRKWNFESLLRRGLQPALLPEPLFLGQGVHIGLDHGYRGGLEAGGVLEFNTRRAVLAFTEWSKQRIEALITHAGQLWEDEKETYEGIVQLGKVMLVHYGLWASSIDSAFKVLGLEKRFKVSVPGSMTVSYEGRFDGLVYHKGSKELYILEFKTSKYMTDQRLATVFRDIQSSAYQWAAQKVYKMPVAGVVYRVLWKKEPDMPVLTSRGTFSRDKRQHMTEHWLNYVLDSGVQEDENPALARAFVTQASAELRNMLRQKQERFFMQKLIKHSPEQLAFIPRILRTIGGEMTSSSVLVFPMPGFHCSFCRFKDPCDLMEGHRDLAEDVLQAEFAPRTYWEDFELDGGEDN